MADSPETAIALSDDDLDELVQGAEGSDSPVTTDPEPESPAPATFVADDANEEEAPVRPEAGEQVVVDDAGPHAAPAAPPAPAPVGQPFRFKASGGEHVLPGALELPDGSVVIAKDGLSTFRQTLSSAVELRENFKTLQRNTARQLAAAKAERTDKDIEADAVIALLSDIKKMSPDERWDYFEKFEQELPKLELAVQKQQLERDRKALQEQRSPTLMPEELAEQRTATLTAELRQTYARVMQHDAIKALSPDEVNAVFQKHAKRPDRLVRKGEKEGEEIFDDSDVIEDLNLLVQMKERLKGTAAAKAKNDTRNADTNPIPPTVRTAVPAAPAKQNGKKSYAGDRRGFKDAFMKGDLDE